MTFRRRLTSKQREELYRSECDKARAAGNGDYAICNICSFPILPGREWDESHDHRRHNNQIDTPLFAKSERIRKRHLDFTRSRNPLPGGRDDSIRKKINGRVEARRV